MFPGQIQRASLGRSNKIGAFYDIRTDNFLSGNLFGSKVDSIVPFATDIGDTSTELVMSDSLQDKFKGLEVDPELQVSVLSGLVELSGSGAYLKEERQSARARSMSLLYKIKTVNEMVIINQHKDRIDMETLKQATNATHVVTGIGWGAVCSITCEYENKEDDDFLMVEEAVGKELDKLKMSVDVTDSETAAHHDGDGENHKSFTFTCKADVSSPDKNLPVTFNGSVELARSLPRLVGDMNDGKGVPLTYMLVPLDAALRMCKLQREVQIQHRAISEEFVKKCVLIVDGITKKRQAIFDTRCYLHAYHDYVAQEDLTRISNIYENHVDKESNFRVILRDLVTNVRSDRKQVSSLKDFLSKEQQGTISDATDHKEICTFQKNIDRISFVESMKNRKIDYLGRDRNIIVNDSKNVYVFYRSSNEYDKKNRERNQQFFLRLKTTHCKDDRGYKFIIVDEEIRKDIWPATQMNSSIHMYVNGHQESKDLYAREGQGTEMCLIKIEKTTQGIKRPRKRAFLKLRCPNALSGNGQCAENPTTWLCLKCKELVEYGIETKCFYCKCGESDPRRSCFRCNEVDHGMLFIKYPENTLRDDLSRHQALKEMNILILGETGVGKSTWINGFQNYLNFNDLEEAVSAEELHVLIPSKFTFTQKGVSKVILIEGKSENEVLEAGKSATKQAHSYIFYKDDYRVDLIDTPGIGTTEGVQQDKQNLDNILSYLMYYDEIHAVCILLKPNSSRVTPTFNFCIQELLANLHSSAKDNIVFCFTNARATFYQPGDTLPALNKLLQDRKVGMEANPFNYFCFDNEPFRFLACRKKGLKFDPTHTQNYIESWNRSVEETKRLFTHIESLTPHKVKDTVSLNEARRIILIMSKPLAEVAKTIEFNLRKGQEVKRELDNYDEDVECLEKNLTFPGFDLKCNHLALPRTVCAHPKCVKHVPVGAERVQNTIYPQVCHDNCTLRGISPETTNSAKFLFCRSLFFRVTSCRECGHNYTHHMHMTYEMEVVATEFISEEVQEQINEKKSQREKTEAAKRVIDEKCTELLEEQKIIMVTSAKFGSFLKANAIIPYNDAVGDYLDMSIKLESSKTKEMRNDDFLNRLREMKDQYTQEREIIDKAIPQNSNKSLITPWNVIELKEELFDLKHTGQTLKGFFDEISALHSTKNIIHPETVAPILQHRKIAGIRSAIGEAINTVKMLKSKFKKQKHTAELV